MERKTIETTRTEPIRPTNAYHLFNIVIRDEAHFRTIIRWMNANIGMGRENWSMSGRQVLNHVKEGKKPKVTIYIMHGRYDEEGLTYLSLL